MGVDCRIILTSRPDVHDIGDVLARLDGAEGNWDNIPSWRVPCAKVTTSSVVGLTCIQWMSAENENRTWTWHDDIYQGLCGSIP